MKRVLSESPIHLKETQVYDYSIDKWQDVK